MSGAHLYPDNAFLPRRETASAPTSFLCQVGRTPLSRQRFSATSGERLCPDIVFTPRRENTSPRKKDRGSGLFQLHSIFLFSIFYDTELVCHFYCSFFSFQQLAF